MQAEPPCDYLVGDYLAELTMAILVAKKAKNPEKGYATDFVRTVAEHADMIAKRKARLAQQRLRGGICCHKRQSVVSDDTAIILSLI